MTVWLSWIFLGHDDPMVLKDVGKYLQEDVDPNFDPKKIPVGDEETMRIFQDTSSLALRRSRLTVPSALSVSRNVALSLYVR